MAENLVESSDDEKYTIVDDKHDDKHGLALPYFDLFCKQLEYKNVTSEEVMYACDLHTHYISQVDKKTCDKLSLTSANGYRRFCTRFTSYARKKNIVKVNYPKSGYMVRLSTKRFARVVRHQNTYVLPENVHAHLLSHHDLRESSLHLRENLASPGLEESPN